jgi:hypothetical protein
MPEIEHILFSCFALVNGFSQALNGGLHLRQI